MFCNFQTRNFPQSGGATMTLFIPLPTSPLPSIASLPQPGESRGPVASIRPQRGLGEKILTRISFLWSTIHYSRRQSSFWMILVILPESKGLIYHLGILEAVYSVNRMKAGSTTAAKNMDTIAFNSNLMIFSSWTLHGISQYARGGGEGGFLSITLDLPGSTMSLFIWRK